jgi:gamma-glutamyl:cysteine ligase YbdK (ATP-grasp superfamily)
MSELINEDDRAHEAFNDALRHQVVVASQHIRVHLRVVDRLMDLYNKSIAATSGNKA